MTIGSDSNGLGDGVQEARAPVLAHKALQHLEQQIENRFRRFEERLEEIVECLDALGIDTHKSVNELETCVYGSWMEAAYVCGRFLRIS
ncbi:hypothetical protein K2173_019930 [Erythroxylum novogranatense]|uniref:Uncharacterized protein n=1 Tax=Erythroxylum novogranatense TaxID=1862640 RepID=A0AAV8U6I7_9ROSI|nr:hypothetical protein K2173_019930 [Erythroxylum novogranatense]